MYWTTICARLRSSGIGSSPGPHQLFLHSTANNLYNNMDA